MIKKETMDNIIDRLDDSAREYGAYEYGLPVLDSGQRALMREAIREEIEKEEQENNQNGN